MLLSLPKKKKKKIHDNCIFPEDRHRVSRMGSIASRASSFFESIGKSKGKKMAASLPTSNSLGNLVETGSETNSQLDLIIPKDNTAYTTSFNKNMCHSIEDLVCDRNTLYQGRNIGSPFKKFCFCMFQALISCRSDFLGAVHLVF